MPSINPDVLETAGSGIREIMNRVFTRPDAIRLEVGEPSFPTPEPIRQAAERAVRDSRTHYTPTPGLADLRTAIQEKVSRINHVVRPVEGIMVTPGAGSALFLSMKALLQMGDGILMPDPGWSNYFSMGRALGLRVIPYALDPPTFVPDLAALEALIDPGVKAILMNFPSNPTGSVPDRAWTEKLADIARRHDLWIISDEVYDELVFEGEAVSPAQFAPERTIGIYSFSKTYAMTGWRMGYIAAEAEVTPWLVRLAEQIWQCVNEPTQIAGIAALTGDQSPVVEMREAYRRRRDLGLETAQALGLRTFKPQGAFYLMVDVAPSGKDSRTFALELLDREGVAVVPGTAFGTRAGSMVRLSLAASEDAIREGIRRIARTIPVLEKV